jgi:hypothetical protein
MAIHPAGVCQFCKITDAEVDGDRISWLNDKRNCCNGAGCVRAYNAKARDRAADLARATRKRTPAEIDALKKEERAARRRRARQALEARGLLKGSA